MANDLQRFQAHFSGVSFRARREIIEAVRVEAERLAAAIKAAAPRGETGNLAESVTVRRRRGGLTLDVVAGGDLTTKAYDRGTGYERAVVIDGRDNRGIAKKQGGDHVTYDYALAKEYGTSNEHAEPFFFPTVRSMQDQIRANLEAAIRKAFR